MATHLGRHLASLRDRLLYEPVSRRIRVSLDGHPVADTIDAALVWEPHRIVPMYAIPESDFAAGLVPVDRAPTPDPVPVVLPPLQVFEVHLTDGQSFDVHVGERVLTQAAFRFADADLEGRVLLDWNPFTWMEEAVPVMGHPHDAFKRIDVLPSDRHVVVGYGGQVLADSRQATALYETHIPVRWYFPRQDVRMDLLTRSESQTVCAYKGVASYLSLAGDPDAANLAWTYPDPLHDAEGVRDLVCFYNEWTDLEVDGVALPRPVTPFTTRGGD